MGVSGLILPFYISLRAGPQLGLQGQTPVKHPVHLSLERLIQTSSELVGMALPGLQQGTAVSQSGAQAPKTNG